MKVDIKAYECDSCEKKFGNAETLKRHLQIVHENIKAYKYNSCEKEFGQKAHLKGHIKVVHENINYQGLQM